MCLCKPVASKLAQSLVVKVQPIRSGVMSIRLEGVVVVSQKGAWAEGFSLSVMVV